MRFDEKVLIPPGKVTRPWTDYKFNSSNDTFWRQR